MRTLFGDKEGAVGKAVGSVVDFVANRAEIIVKEGITESFEEGVVGLVTSAINLGEGLIDDVTSVSNLVSNMFNGFFVGNGVTTTFVAARDVANAGDKLKAIAGDIGKAGTDIVSDVVAKVNTGVRDVIDGAKAGVINDAQARETLAEYNQRRG